MNRKERRQREKLRRTRGASPLPEGLQEAVSLHQTGRIRDALPLYQRFLTEQPDHPDALNYCGLAIYQLGDAGQALNLINAAIQIEPTNAGAYNNLGLAFQKLGRLAEAEGAYRRALTLQPKASQVHSNLGNILQTNGKYDEAVDAYRRAIAIKPDSAEALNNLGNVLKKQRKLDEALVAYRDALKYWPDNPDTHNNLGVLLQAAGKLEEAITNFQHALEIKPDNAEAYFNLGGVYRELGRIDEAIAAYQQTIELKPDLNVYDNLGSLLLDGGTLNRSTPALQRVMEKPEENPAACANLAGLLADGDDLDGAEALAREAMQADAKLPDAAANLAKVLVEKGKLKEALATYEAIPKTLGQSLASHINFAVTLFRHQRIDEGIGVIDSIIAEPQLTANQRYALFVNKGIYAWLRKDFAALGDCLQACTALSDIIDRTTIDASLCIYQLYLERLLHHCETNPALYAGSPSNEIHVIGESHSLSPNGTVVTFEGTPSKIASHLLIGCKAWHLSQPSENYFQRGLRSALSEVPKKGTVIACFGEIDCRHNEGVFHHHRKQGGDLDAIIRKTVEGYVAFVTKATAARNTRLLFTGVPAPHHERPALREFAAEDRTAYLEAIANFNRQLKEVAEAKGAAVIDVYGLTAGGDGVADGKWHIDHHHLRPDSLREIFAR